MDLYVTWYDDKQTHNEERKYNVLEEASHQRGVLYQQQQFLWIGCRK